MKKLTIFLLLIFSLFSLSACNNDDGFILLNVTTSKAEYLDGEEVTLIIQTTDLDHVNIREIIVNDVACDFIIEGNNILLSGFTFSQSTKYTINRIYYDINGKYFIMKVGRSVITNPVMMNVTNFIIINPKKEYKTGEMINLEITVQNPNRYIVRSFTISGKEYEIKSDPNGNKFIINYQLGNERINEYIGIENIKYVSGVIENNVAVNMALFVEVRPIIPLLVILLVALLVLVIYFTQDAIAAEIYEKKGYSKFEGAVLGLIPIYGLIQVLTAPSKKEIHKDSLKQFYSLKEIFMKFLSFGQLVILAVLVVLPVIYLIGSSFSNTSGLPTTFWPAKMTMDNYDKLINDTKFEYWYFNTVAIAVINMIVGVVFITGASYVFARFKFKGKKAGLMTILVLQVFPSFMGMIAMFTLFETFGMLGRPLALSILYVGGAVPYNLWLIKGYLQQIPKDLDESAMLDGANKWQIFSKIILPLSVPIISFVAVSLFMAPWMDYMLPKFLLDVPARGSIGSAESVKQQWTLAVGLFEMISGADKQNYTTFAAGALIVALPITVLYMIFQRYLIQGITAGATKG